MEMLDVRFCTVQLIMDIDWIVCSDAVLQDILFKVEATNFNRCYSFKCVDTQCV